MNNFLKMVFLVCVLKATAKAMTKEEGHAMFLNIVNTCKDLEGASEKDALELMTHSIPTTKAGECLNICVMDKAGITKDGKFSVECSIKLAEFSGDPSKPKNIAAAGKVCESVVAADRCELARKIMECLHKECAARGINPATDLL